MIIGMVYKRNIYDDQFVVINGSQLKGVQSFNGNWSLPKNNMTAAGYESVGSEVEGAIVGEVSVDRLIVNGSDPIPPLLGSSINGELIYGPNQAANKSFYFNVGYINSYSSSCSIGEIATSNFGLTAYGNVGEKGSASSASYAPYSPKVASANSMTLSTSFGDTNAIQSYDLNLSLNVNPIYKIGSMFIPSKFEIATPIVIETSFEIFANEYEIKNLMDGICGTDFVENLSISLNEKCDGPAIETFTLNNAELIDASINATIGSNLSISLQFQNLYSDISTLVSQVF
jgi:hypothetical protein